VRAIAVLGALLALAAAPAPSPSGSAPPPAQQQQSAASEAPAKEGLVPERLLWNARERTAKAIDELGGENAGAAVSDFDRARRLRPDDPRTTFNAGTARIGSDPAAAAGLLEPVARVAPEALSSDAWYNLGNARLAAGDPGAALDAYVESLRRSPARVDAKYNLELARRALEEQQKKQQRQQQQGDSDDQQQQPREQSGQGEQKQDRSGEQQSSENGQDGQDRDQQNPAPQQNGAPGQPGSQQDSKSPLPQFHDLPDMTAEQAAAILQAVDNLEKRQRREKALQAAAARADVEIDW